MIKIVVVAHNELAQELVNSAEVIAGKQSNIYVIKMGVGDTLVQMQKRIDSLLQSINDKDGTLILTDMIGGTPFNASVQMSRFFNAEVISGVNLPMILSAVFASKDIIDISTLADKVLLDGKKSIVNVKDTTRVLK